MRITPKHCILHCYAGATAQGETHKLQQMIVCAQQAMEMQRSPMPWQRRRMAVTQTRQRMLQMQTRSSLTSMTMSSQIGTSTR